MIHSLLVCLSFAILYSAQASAVEGFGDVASHINEPISVVIHLVRAVSVICGSGLILGGVLKFIEYRRNPVAVRLSAVIYMLVFGMALIGVSFIPPGADG